MDNVFHEEQKKLEEIEAKIDSMAINYENLAANLQSEIQDFFTIDYEDVQNKQILHKKRQDAINKAKKLRSYQNAPYFGRIDLGQDEKEDIDSFYIGKEAISDDNSIIVVDWRTPIGECYYAQNQKEFDVKGIKYFLSLRRSLDIKNAKLHSYKTEYDGEAVSLEGDVIDPFLLDVLKDKRRHNRLTDIIRTIQGNQNDIIRKPISESFVVQGCAGSGKTMILLHRLSYLIFNHRDLSTKSTKIITPNKFFDAHINDLSKELGLSNIERFSVEEFYVYLIKKHSNKITAKSEVLSEKSLNRDMLEDIYSDKYMNDSITNYHNYWIQLLNELDESKLKNLFKKFKIDYPNTKMHNFDIANRLENGITRILSSASMSHEQIKQLSKRLDDTETNIEIKRKEYNEALIILNELKSNSLNSINAEISSSKDKLSNLDKEITIKKEHLNDINKQINQKIKEYSINSSLTKQFTDYLEQSIEYDEYTQNNNLVTEYISEKCSTLIAEIVSAETAYEKTPIYNFGKRSGLRKQIAELKDLFKKAVEFSISDKANELTNENIILQNSRIELTSRAESIEKEIKALKKEISSIYSFISSLKYCAELIETNNIPNFKSKMNPSSYKECLIFISPCEDHIKKINSIVSKLDGYIQTKNKLEEDRLKLSKSIISTDEIDYIEYCAEVIKEIHFSEISSRVLFKNLISKYKEYKQSYRHDNYRHKLYLNLLFCNLYFSNITNIDTFLNIDEAQDISVSEYKLLKKIHGGKCIFNLYGDINQSVYTYKGISDWDDIKTITSGNIYILNENYRNTKQITDFCNNEFESEIVSIGISGAPVLELNLESALKWIEDLKKQHPEYRVAIIHRYGLSSLQDFLRSQLDSHNVSWGIVDEKKISVISVETAKGLEFEAAISIIDHMTNNEKYVSYTRALNYLTIVRDKSDNNTKITQSSDMVVANSETISNELNDASLITVSADNELNDVSSENDLQDYSNDSSLSNNEHSYDKFYSWEILNETTAIKTCDKSFFIHNCSGIPQEISWFFETDAMKKGEKRKIKLEYENRIYDGEIKKDNKNPPRLHIVWYKDLGHLLNQHKSIVNVKAIFEKSNKDLYRIAILNPHTEMNNVENDDEIIESQDELDSNEATINSQDLELENNSDDIVQISAGEYAYVAELNSILKECFDSNQQLSSMNQNVIISLLNGRNVAYNAPSGSLKSVVLYLMALYEHRKNGKQTLITAKSYLQENELVLAERLGLKCGAFVSIEDFCSDARKDKYDLIFVSNEYIQKCDDISSFINCFVDKIAYWGIDHPSSSPEILEPIKHCCKTLKSNVYLMSNDGFGDIDLSDFDQYETETDVNNSIVKKLTFISSKERINWLLQNKAILYGQGIIYCSNDLDCKEISKCFRKNRIAAEAYINVENNEETVRINYLTKQFSTGSLPILITTHEIGKNISNPNIRFIIHYDVPKEYELCKLHIAQIGQLSENPVVYDFYVTP